MSSLLGSHSYFSFFINISSLTFLFQSPMQVNDTGGPPAPDTLPPMPPLTSLAPAAEAIPTPHFLVSLFSRLSLPFFFFPTLIYFLSLLLHLYPLLALMVVLLRKVCFSFFSLFFFLTCLFIAHTIFHTI